MPEKRSTPRTCEQCGGEFLAKPSFVRKGQGRFCSRSCAVGFKNSKPWPERFWDKVRVTDGCWLWIAHTDRAGYGRIWQNNIMSHAHRVSWELCNGPIPNRLHVLHQCDNPPCVNPDHLALGTHADNMRESAERYRRYNQSGENNVNTTLTEDQVREMRRRYAAGGINRQRLANEYGVSHHTASGIVSGKSWRYVPLDVPIGD